MMRLEPRKQRGPEIETDAGVVVRRAFDGMFCPNDVGEGVRSVALVVNALVPVVIRMRAGLSIYDAGPGILARWLIKVSVND